MSRPTEPCQLLDSQSTSRRKPPQCAPAIPFAPKSCFWLTGLRVLEGQWFSSLYIRFRAVVRSRRGSAYTFSLGLTAKILSIEQPNMMSLLMSEMLAIGERRIGLGRDGRGDRRSQSLLGILRTRLLFRVNLVVASRNKLGYSRPFLRLPPIYFTYEQQQSHEKGPRVKIGQQTRTQESEEIAERSKKIKHFA